MERGYGGYRILLADDDKSVHDDLLPYFRAAGFEMISAFDGAEALSLFRRLRPDLILLDLVMPEKDGLTVCREARKESFLPILVLSAKTDEFDRLMTLEVGADDYITKPYSPREVIARIRVLLRRVHEYSAPVRNTHLVAGNLDLDRGSYRVKIGGEEIACTPKELEILWVLASNPGYVFSREHLLQSVWGYDYAGDSRAVDSHIKRLRAKIGQKCEGWYIRTIWGGGYRFEIREDK